MVVRLLRSFLERNSFNGLTQVTIHIFITSLIGTVSATGRDDILTNHQDLSSQIPSLDTITSSLFANWITFAHSMATTVAISTIASVKAGTVSLGSICWMYPLNITIWFICITLVIVSCVAEQDASNLRMWFATCLGVTWLVATILHVHKVIRRFQSIGRADSFIVTTSMLSFALIKAFAILGGYNIVAILRVPPCFTLAAWIASRWCKFNATPDVHAGV